tara:strand:- start:2475 stop:3719 length:1245 start_codon:yes stop_codon:yes gene_type:complete
MNKQVVTKYLRLYAEPESRNATAILQKSSFDYCIVIPAFQEEWSTLEKVWRSLDENVLVILVANSPVDLEPQTMRMIADVKSRGHALNSDSSITYLKISDSISILLVDRCSESIPVRQGVGLARKIGADIALRLIDSRLIHIPWIFNTDADVILPPDYFDRLKQVQNTAAALLYPFEHEPDTHHTACYLYEISLLYYVAGLHHARSPYAFFTVASTIAVNADHYAAVRGFPVKNAAEDFYLLNKLAKTGLIQQLSGPNIKISGRLSERVPFGTGLGIKKILAQSTTDFCLYNPRVFDQLKRLLVDLNNCQQASDLNRHFVVPEIDHWCKKMGLIELIRSKQNQRREVFDKFIDDWMDGFRTLKFIHFLRDHYYDSIPWEDALQAKFLPQPVLENLGETRSRLQHHILHTTRDSG